jgi:DNA-binding GntR family transcriptional regulator
MSKKKGLGEAAYNTLRRHIIECRIAPGAVVTQSGLRQLAELGPLRAALMRLTQEGLIRAVPRQGYVVSELTVQDAEDIMQVRIMLEREAAFLAAGRVPAAALLRIRKGFAARYEAGAAESISRWLANNRLFKLTIAEATGNAWLVRQIAGLLDQYERYVRLSHQKVDRYREMTEGAEALIVALERGDGIAARRLTEEHLVRTRDAIVQILLSSSELRQQALTMRPTAG